MNYKGKTNEELIKIIEGKDKIIEELNYQATTDYTTKILNKRAGMNIIRQKINESDINGTNVIVCFIDINNFKKVNDTFGHDKGDSILKNVCQKLKQNIRKSDILVRWGGDEFLIIFPNATKKVVNKILNRVCKNICQEEQGITISYGLSEYLSQSGVGIKWLIDKADKEMYNVKKHIKLKEIEKKTINKMLNKCNSLVY